MMSKLREGQPGDLSPLELESRIFPICNVEILLHVGGLAPYWRSCFHLPLVSNLGLNHPFPFDQYLNCLSETV